MKHLLHLPENAFRPLAVLLLMILSLTLLFGCASSQTPSGSASDSNAGSAREGSEAGQVMEVTPTTLYYTDESWSSLTGVSRVVNFSGANSLKSQLDELFHLLQEPQALPEPPQDLRSVIPEEIFKRIYLETEDSQGRDGANGAAEANVLYVEVDKSYETMEAAKRVIFRSGLSQTMFSLNSLSRIDFVVIADDMVTVVDSISRTEQMIIGGYDEGIYRDEVKVVLYFASSSETGLAAEERTIRLNMTESLPSGIVKALVDGPASGSDLKRTIPEGTKINEIVVEEGVCYVDLSENFVLNHSGGEIQEKLTIYSLVNSLCRVSGIDYVQILIDGKKTSFYKTYVPIDSFLVFDETIVD
ncbi:MAG: GerMN domain-containing protein [Firmicutes bacterium]|nr:GerMN domain-containing protein [Bacillota bacterium]